MQEHGMENLLALSGSEVLLQLCRLIIMKIDFNHQTGGGTHTPVLRLSSAVIPATGRGGEIR